MSQSLKTARLCMLVAFSASIMTGCVTPPQQMYYWGGYQAQVNSYFAGEKSPEEQIKALELEAEKAKSQGKALPPGFQAHLALLYGKTGKPDRLVENLEAEKRQFPESTAFVDFIMKKINH